MFSIGQLISNTALLIWHFFLYFVLVQPQLEAIIFPFMEKITFGRIRNAPIKVCEPSNDDDDVVFILITNYYFSPSAILRESFRRSRR